MRRREDMNFGSAAIGEHTELVRESNASSMHADLEAKKRCHACEHERAAAAVRETRWRWEVYEASRGGRSRGRGSVTIAW
jgi:hypothetical protein